MLSFQVAAEVLVHGEGTMVLTNPTFLFDALSNINIVNLGGQIRCEDMECLELCTACELVPSESPAVSPTPQPKFPTHADSKSSSLLIAAAAGGLVTTWLVVAVIWRRRQICPQLQLETPLGNQQPLLGQDDRVAPAVELVGCSVMTSFELSPAPIFVVGRDSMCVVKWSPGMEIAAPILGDPVGLPVADLPFVDQSDGHRFDRDLRRIFEAPAEHNNARTFMLYLRTQNGCVLLETRADHLVTETEAIVVFTGREVDSDLACMIARESAAAVSESYYDANASDSGADGERFRSVSEAGSIKGARTDGTLHSISNSSGTSVISSLTMPTLKSVPSKGSDSIVSSLTAPSVAPSSLAPSLLTAPSLLSSARDSAISRSSGPAALQEDEIGSADDTSADDTSSHDDYVAKVLLQFVLEHGQQDQQRPTAASSAASTEVAPPSPRASTPGSSAMSSIELDFECGGSGGA